MKTLSLRKPYLHSTIIRLDMPRSMHDIFSTLQQNATYLSIPTKLDCKQDVKLGAQQFAELNTLVEKENEPKYILITVDNLEQGYMAVTYLAAAFNSKHEEYEGYGEDNMLDNTESVMKEWEESPFRIPVIREEELLTQVGDEYFITPLEMEGMASLVKQNKMCNNPYWLNCRQYSVCVVTGNYCEEDDSREKALRYFNNNDKVYIICENNKQNFRYGYFDNEESSSEETIRKQWNAIVLALTMDEANVVLDR